MIENSQMANHYGGFEYGDRNRSSGNATKPAVYLSSTTNVKVQSDELDVFGGYSYGSSNATFYGSVIEVT